MFKTRYVYAFIISTLSLVFIYAGHTPEVRLDGDNLFMELPRSLDSAEADKTDYLCFNPFTLKTHSTLRVASASSGSQELTGDIVSTSARPLIYIPDRPRLRSSYQPAVE